MEEQLERRVFADVEEIGAAVGSRIGSSKWITITQDRINAFAETTGDHQWIHIDPERAQSGPFGRTIAHGFLTLSLASQFLIDAIVITAPVTLINYGLNRTRFPAPVPVESRIRGHVKIVSLTPNSLGHELVTQVTVEVEGADKPACVSEMITMLTHSTSKTN